MITWEEYVKDFMEKRIKEFSGLRRLARAYAIDPSIISRIVNGKYVPSRKTLKEAFPDYDIPEVITIIKEES